MVLTENIDDGAVWFAPDLVEGTYLDRRLLAVIEAQHVLEDSRDRSDRAVLVELARRERELRSWLPSH